MLSIIYGILLSKYTLEKKKCNSSYLFLISATSRMSKLTYSFVAKVDDN